MVLWLGTARAAGARVLLVEKCGFLGGAATHSQVLADGSVFLQGEKLVKVVDGVADHVRNEMHKTGLDCAPPIKDHFVVENLVHRSIVVRVLPISHLIVCRRKALIGLFFASRTIGSGNVSRMARYHKEHQDLSAPR